MFQIRKEQMAFFERREREGFLDRMASYLASAHPRRFEGQTPEGIRGWVSGAIDKARRFGVDTEPEAAQLVLLFLLLGLDADQRLPWAREALLDPGLLPLGKLRRLVRLLREHRVDGVDSFLLNQFKGRL
jgi:hypothetical protein